MSRSLLSQDVDAMQDNVDGRLAISLHVFFSIVVWPVEIPAQYRRRATLGTIQ